MIVLSYQGRPEITSLSPNVIVVEGQSVEIICTATNDIDALEDVTIRWFNNMNIRLNNNDDRITITDTMETGPNRVIMSTLIIDPVIYQDAGPYRCQALNHAILRVSNITQLTVQCKLS